MREFLVIFTLFSPHAPPMEQVVPMYDCEVVKARLEQTWANAPEGFYGVLTCERRRVPKKKEEK